MGKPVLYLIDGSSYIFRAYYAIKSLNTSKGFPTNAVYGFASMLFKFLKDYNPQYLGIVFDSQGDTFRNKIYPLYKANRSAPPDGLVPQFSKIFELVDGFNVPQYQIDGFEADDVMGAIAKVAEQKGMEVVLVTGDKDFYQLVSANITLLDTMKNRQVGIEEVMKKYRVTPNRIIDVFALAGDVIDNIPGVKGIGEKTAISLIAEFGSLDGLLENMDKVTSRQRALIEENREDALLSRRLFTIKTDIQMGLDVWSFKYEGLNKAKLGRIFRDLEFKNLLREIGEPEVRPRVPSGKDNHSETGSAIQQDQGGPAHVAEDSTTASHKKYRLVLSLDELDKVISRIKDTGEVAIALETTSTKPMLAQIVGITLCPVSHEAYYIPVTHRNLSNTSFIQLDISYVLEKVKPLLESKYISKVGHNLKHEIVVLKRYGVNMSSVAFDAIIASHMIDSSRGSYSLGELSSLYLDRRIVSYKDVTTVGKSRITFDELELEPAKEYAAKRANLAIMLSRVLKPELEKIKVAQVFKDVELEFIQVLAQVEMNGVKVDAERLKELSNEFEIYLEKVAKEIYAKVGYEFNLNSPLQLRRVLFDTLGLPKSKLTKKGEPSTDVEVLNNLSKLNPVPQKVLEHRALSKLKSTYVDSLPKLINSETGRIHTFFNPVGSSTGRLSSSDPNLQNIPIKTMQGKRIREAFIPEKGYVLLSADYSQIELRLLAHFSQDKSLVEAFVMGSDIHNRTASEIFGVAGGMVTPEMRRFAKNINFGIIYGISAFGLAKQLGTSVSVAKSYIEEYFRRYDSVKEYIEKSISEARDKGYAETILGRRRPIPELQSGDRNRRGFGERMAMNTPIQGSAADIIKIAMVSIHKRLINGYESRMILQVHDELLFEVKETELDDLSQVVRQDMEGAWELSVPLKVDIGTGINWAQSH